MLFLSKRIRRWTGIFLSVLLTAGILSTAIPSKALEAANETELDSIRQKTHGTCETTDLRVFFDQLDEKGGEWYKDANNELGHLAFREAYVLQSYLLMYETYRDTGYLDKFVDHADSVLKQRDSVRQVTDYRGLSLPAWRHTDPPDDSNPLILGGRYYHVAVDTASIAYPFAWFAQLIKCENRLYNYDLKADTYIRAAAEAVAVHDDEWRESGAGGYYIFRKDSPYWCDGVGVPFNQNLGMGRTLLKMYQITGETKYLDRVIRIARHFQNNLTLDTDRYVWNYWWGYGYNGWSDDQQISANTPSYGGYKKFEDFRHGVVSADFIVLAYQAGIVFTEEAEIYRFAKTIEKNLTRTDGGINEFVSGSPANSGSSPDSGNTSLLIGLWMRYHKVAPSLFDRTCEQVIDLSTVGAPGLLVVAYLNWAQKNRIRTTPSLPVQTNKPVLEPAQRVEESQAGK